MAALDVIVGYVRGLKGDTGETGATGATGEAATISVGTVSTAAYGQQAQVTNVGTSEAAVFDFVIPEGRPGEVLADMSNLTNNTITTSTSEFPVPAVGDTGAILWGKVVKFFSDIRAAVNAKIDSSKITTSLAVTTTGSVADATVSKVLNDKITTLNNSVNAKIDTSKITTSLAVTTTGSVADATVSKVLNDKITTLNNSVTNVVEEMLTLSYNGKSANIYFRKYLNVLSILITKEAESMELPTTWTNVGTLENIKAPSDRYIPFISSNGLTGTFRLYKDGGVRFIAHSNDAYWLQTSATVLL